MKEKTMYYVAAYQSYLVKEFNDQEYSEQCLFFSDGVEIRQAKFMIWLMKKYGVEEQFLRDLERFEIMALLKKKS